PERAPRRTPGRSRDDARYLLRAVRARDTLGARALARADAFGERVSCPQVGGRALSDVARVRVAPRRDPRRRRRVVVVRARRDRLPPERAGRGVSAPLPIRGGHDEQRPEPEGRRVLPRLPPPVHRPGRSRAGEVAPPRGNPLRPGDRVARGARVSVRSRSRRPGERADAPRARGDLGHRAARLRRAARVRGSALSEARSARPATSWARAPAAAPAGVAPPAPRRARADRRARRTRPGPAFGTRPSPRPACPSARRRASW